MRPSKSKPVLANPLVSDLILLKGTELDEESQSDFTEFSKSLLSDPLFKVKAKETLKLLSESKFSTQYEVLESLVAPHDSKNLRPDLIEKFKAKYPTRVLDQFSDIRVDSEFPHQQKTGFREQNLSVFSQMRS